MNPEKLVGDNEEIEAVNPWVAGHLGPSNKHELF